MWDMLQPIERVFEAAPANFSMTTGLKDRSMCQAALHVVQTC